MKRYDPAVIEPKWQQIWDETKLYEVEVDPQKRKLYATPMLPYPSGAGLHIGHVRNYSISDTVARFYRQRGFNVMSNIGWDSFGLPAENYAIKTGTPPWESTQENIMRFKNQLKRLGMSYDWSREIDTSDPKYYKWTQWIFLQLHKNGLAYQAESLQWWCPQCQTVLANEQVVNGCCWRHEETPVIKKRMNQWFFKITEYVDELLDNTADLNWPEHIKTMQKNWIGRSEGAEITFNIDGSNSKLTVFTTRPDTLFGATFMVVAPEHPLLKKITKDEQADAVHSYITDATKKSDVDRMDDNREKTGVFTGSFAINPVNDEKIPIWVADYVLMAYGTGAIMAVPAHDERDWHFARKFGIDHRHVFKQKGSSTKSFYTGEGIMVNSDSYDGMSTADAREKIVSDLAQKKLAKSHTNYKIHDWLISRQRYWGAPIPIIHCDKCGAVPVPEDDLPIILPRVDRFAPDGSGTSVLATVEEWVNVKCPMCSGPARRETDTMDGYACSSWYMHRYTDPNNDKRPWDPEKLNYWFPVDYYFGGDHAVSHLLYFRFWNHFFADKGLVAEKEPVKRLVFNGYINAADGTKMSKSKGNVVDPLEIIDSGYGADALRLFELFVGPYDQDVDWNPGGVPGTYRFLQRVWTLVQSFIEAADEGQLIKVDNQQDHETLLLQAVHRTTKKVTDDLDRLSFNTAVAALMELVNTANSISKELSFNTETNVWRETCEKLVAMIAPFAPHIAEELWHELGHEQSVHMDSWPTWDEEYIKQAMLTIVVQVDGKLRANVQVAAGTSMEEIVDIARKEENVSRHLKGKKITNTVKVPEKLINFVTK